MMICQGCQKETYQIHGYMDDQGIYKEACSECGNVASSDASVPDVYWNGRPYYSEALQVEFTSRSQKARVMKERGLSELGSQKLGEKSWTEGSRDYRKKNFEKDRPMIREAYRRYLENAKYK
jgi:hypothetical protein